MKTVALPPAVLADPNATEMLRVWIAEKGLHCSLRIGMYANGKPVSETEAWGMILADAIHHIADALASQGHGEQEDLARQIFERLESEFDEPSSPRKGGFVVSN